MLGKYLLRAFVFLTLLFSCGSDQEQIIRSFRYSIDNNVFSFSLEFNQDVELNTEYNIPILDYGSVTLTPPASGKGFIIGGTMNLDVIADERLPDMTKTRLLPNGQAMSTYVTTDLTRMRLEHDSMIHSNIYLGPDAQHLYLGTALELGYIDQNFPAGLVISARIHDEQKRPVGVLSIFGPKVENGELVSPGGIFFVTNISDLIQHNPQGRQIYPYPIYDMNTFREFVEVNEPYTKKYSDPFKINKLLKDVQKAAKEAGYAD